MGHYTEAFELLARELGFQPVTPPLTTQETIKKGVRHSSDMVCFPFKSTLANLIEGLENGADSILVPGLPLDNKPQTCRFLYYYHIHEQILKRLGYKFEVFYLRWGGLSIIKNLKRINPKLSTLDCFRLIKKVWKKIVEIEDKYYKYQQQDINIGIVGEVYTMWEEDVNYNIIKKLNKMGVGVDVSVKLSWFIKHQIKMADEKKHLHAMAKNYLPKPIGGHGFESLYNTLYYASNNFDGVIHLAPLSCMPETLVEMPMNFISSDYKIPIYRFPIDENFFEAGFETRLETFVKILKRNKKVI